MAMCNGIPSAGFRNAASPGRDQTITIKLLWPNVLTFVHSLFPPQDPPQPTFHQSRQCVTVSYRQVLEMLPLPHDQIILYTYLHSFSVFFLFQDWPQPTLLQSMQCEMVSHRQVLEMLPPPGSNHYN